MKELEKDNFEKIRQILLQRYKAFEERCSELKLLFDLGVLSFELGYYKDSKKFFTELNEQSYKHTRRSGIVKVAEDLEKRERKIFKGYITYIESKKEAYVKSEEIGFQLKFIPIAQRRKFNKREEVEFNVGFNYRGMLAIDLRTP
ncbi:MAG: protein kinase family protein [Candidatus Syntropharchaeales archaeon]